jgi:hypothetical protein
MPFGVVVAVLVSMGAPLAAQSLDGGASERIWPVEGEYVGSNKCAKCHPERAQSFHANSMSRALEPIEDCEILKRNPRLEWSDGQYRYLIEKQGKGYVYRVTDGTAAAEAILQYAFGVGQSQTYVFQADGHYLESRVSYYQKLKGLSLTMGASDAKPANVQMALGRVLEPAETRDCFGCHSTAARRGDNLQLAKYENGVQCEACHGPGGAHVAAVVGGKPKTSAIRSLKGMSAVETNNLCGACHRTWQMVMLMNIEGVSTVRFQPHRLSLSQCFLSNDSRVACTACHDPHTALAHEDKAYDSKCTACHNPRNTHIGKKTCPVGKEACTACHMPRYELPDAHQVFADHWIRIARKGEGYPE